MKKLTLLITALVCSVVLTACGGGESNVASVQTNHGTPPKSIEGKMIIDNGRGTTNNQDTERVK
ncbi:MAG: hypothetical protein V3U64_02610 [Cocleimonas sp.]